MQAGFAYDAFISYVRADEPWARLIHQQLEHSGFTAFMDTTRLIAGAEWDAQLQDAIENAQHLIVLWSGGAISDWVVHEIAAFQADMRSSAQRDAETPRHIVPIFLEGDYKPLAKYERIDAIRRAAAYDAGPDALPDQVRQAVFEKLDASIRHADLARRVPVLVVTTIRPALDAIDPDAPLPPPPMPGESLRALSARLGFGSLTDLLEVYGDQRGDWRPFGSASTVTGILDQLKDQINHLLHSEHLQPFRWEHLDGFWDMPPGQVAERLKREPVVVVLDPVSLYDPYVSTMTTNHLIPPIRANEHAVVMILPPFALPPGAAALRQSIQGLATEVFESSYNPPVFSGGRSARYVTSVADEVDLKAWLLAGIGPVLAADTGAGSVFTRQ